jgi:hypothetical protein
VFFLFAFGWFPRKGYPNLTWHQLRVSKNTHALALFSLVQIFLNEYQQARKLKDTFQRRRKTINLLLCINLSTFITHKTIINMKLFNIALLALSFGTASAFTTTRSAFTPRLSNPVRATSTSTLQMVAENAKVVLVTGASRGLGRAIAVDLGAQGQKVIVNYAGSEDAANETVEMVKAAGGDAVAIQANCKFALVCVLCCIVKHCLD